MKLNFPSFNLSKSYSQETDLGSTNLLLAKPNLYRIEIVTINIDEPVENCMDAWIQLCSFLCNKAFRSLDINNKSGKPIPYEYLRLLALTLVETSFNRIKFKYMLSGLSFSEISEIGSILDKKTSNLVDCEIEEANNQLEISFLFYKSFESNPYLPLNSRLSYNSDMLSREMYWRLFAGLKNCQVLGIYNSQTANHVISAFKKYGGFANIKEVSLSRKFFNTNSPEFNEIEPLFNILTQMGLLHEIKISALDDFGNMTFLTFDEYIIYLKHIVKCQHITMLDISALNINMFSLEQVNLFCEQLVRFSNIERIALQIDLHNLSPESRQLIGKALNSIGRTPQGIPQLKIELSKKSHNETPQELSTIFESTGELLEACDSVVSVEIGAIFRYVLRSNIEGADQLCGQMLAKAKNLYEVVIPSLKYDVEQYVLPEQNKYLRTATNFLRSSPRIKSLVLNTPAYITMLNLNDAIESIRELLHPQNKIEWLNLPDFFIGAIILATQQQIKEFGNVIRTHVQNKNIKNFVLDLTAYYRLEYIKHHHPKYNLDAFISFIKAAGSGINFKVSKEFIDLLQHKGVFKDHPFYVSDPENDVITYLSPTLDLTSNKLKTTPYYSPILRRQNPLLFSSVRVENIDLPCETFSMLYAFLSRREIGCFWLASLENLDIFNLSEKKGFSIDEQGMCRLILDPINQQNKALLLFLLNCNVSPTKVVFISYKDVLGIEHDRLTSPLELAKELGKSDFVDVMEDHMLSDIIDNRNGKRKAIGGHPDKTDVKECKCILGYKVD